MSIYEDEDETDNPFDRERAEKVDLGSFHGWRDRPFYILDESGQPVPEPDILKWAAWMTDNAERQVVAQHFIGDGPDMVKVSTIFLGFDHYWIYGPGLPTLWETMIFGGPHHLYQERYTSRADAEAGHNRAVILARENK